MLSIVKSSVSLAIISLSTMCTTQQSSLSNEENQEISVADIYASSGDNDSRKEFIQGRRLIIDLPAYSASTGRTWKLIEDQSELRVSNKSIIPPSPSMIGGAAVHRFIFDTNDLEGEFQIVLGLTRPGEELNSDNRFDLHVNVLKNYLQGTETCLQAGGFVSKIKGCSKDVGSMGLHDSIRFNPGSGQVCCIPMNECSDGKRVVEDFSCQSGSLIMRPGCQLSESNGQWLKSLECGFGGSPVQN